jgi:hypothetical protein
MPQAIVKHNLMYMGTTILIFFIREVKNIKKCIKNFSQLMGGHLSVPQTYNWSVVGPGEKVE